MPHIITTARGERIDLDVLKIKGQLAQAPMNIEVERRKKLIDSKEKDRTVQRPLIQNTPEAQAALADIKTESKAEDVPAVENFDAGVVEKPKRK